MSGEVIAELEQSHGVVTEELKSADTFLDALSPRNRRWGDPSSWIYRGQANAEWKLLAKAVRDRNAFAKYTIEGNPLNWTERGVMMNTLLDRFQKGLDRSGIVVPSAIHEVFKSGATMTPSGEPSREHFPLMALAQHHGLPTLLLDWSGRALVAAYFAAVDAANPDTNGLGTHLAVWALRVVYPNDGFDSWGRMLMVYHAPGGTNPNLRAQSGVFTLLRDVNTRPIAETVSDTPAGPFGLEDYVSSTTRPAPGVTPGVFALRQMTLPITEAPKLLRLLSYEGIDGASMFPGADGVVRAMRERALWDVQVGGSEGTS
ncbi:MAG: FRG domain-containing protein [Polyangiaceae bacterium]